MRIGYVSKFSPEKDGGAIYADNLCDNLPCEVVRIGDVESKADYNVNLKSLTLGKKLEEIAEKEKLDLLHVQYVPAGQYFGKYTLNMSLVLALKQKVPFIVTFAEVHTGNGGGLREMVLRWLQKTIATRAGATVAHTQRQAEFLKNYNQRSFQINMGLVLRKMKPRKGKNILFFGMLGFGKGVEHLIKAMDELPDYRLLVAGVGVSDKYAELLRKTAAENRHGNVELDIRWVPDEVKKKYLEEADVMVFPYVWAPYQSGALHDALSYGKPVVVTRTGGVWEIIEKHNAGVVVPPKDAAAIAEGVKNAVRNYSKYQAGIRKYQKEAKWKAVGKKHVEMYKKVLWATR